ncbi:MAG: hypothetical protein JNM75_13950 [Rhodospirillales bacterium]|nr:hypothetical protein [Rhodospirillales bacterium]
MSGWGCPHELEGNCQRVRGRACDPGMKGCILFGRFTFSNEAKNRPHRSEQAASPARAGAKQPPDGNA